MLTIDDTCFQQLLSYDTIIVGLSGGQDSVALLHLLQSYDLIKPKLKALHIHHGLSEHADAWLLFCERLCKQYRIEFIAHKVSIGATRQNLEAKARAARYRVFQDVMGDAPCALVLAHHADDQAETLLLNLFRGAGIEGLSAMPVSRPFASGILQRPLLYAPKDSIVSYIKAHQLDYVEDESNQSCDFSRNYLRHEVIPKIKHKWPRAVDAISQAAQHCQRAREILNTQITSEYPDIAHKVLSLKTLHAISRDKWVFILRSWLQNHAIQSPSTPVFQRIIDEVIDAKKDSIPKLSFGNICIRRYQDTLYLMPAEMNHAQDTLIWENFPSQVTFGAYTLQVKKAISGFYLPQFADISIRKRCGGERMVWRGYTRSLKKLLQLWQIPPWVRDNIPLIFVGDELAIVPGFAVADTFYRSNQKGCFQVMAVIEKDIYEIA